MTEAEMKALEALYREKPPMTAEQNRARLAADETPDEYAPAPQLEPKIVKLREPKSEPKSRSIAKPKISSRSKAGGAQVYWRNPNMGHRGARLYRS